MAKAAKRVRIPKMAAPRPIRKGAVTAWGDATGRFMDHLDGAAEASVHTKRAYRRALARFAKWWTKIDATRRKDEAQEGIPLEPGTVIGSDVRDYTRHLRTEPFDEDDDKRRRKAGAVNALVSPVKSFLGWCYEAGVIKELPVMPKRVKSTRPGYRAIRREDQKKLYRAVRFGRNKRDMAMLRVLLGGGLRVSELCALKWRDVNLKRNEAEVYVWEGKGNKQGAVPLTKSARRALLELKAETGGDPDAPVFLSRMGGEAITPRGVQQMCKKYGRLAGVEFTPHACRHSCATDMVARGDNVATVRTVMRHGSLNTTLTYINTTPEQVRRAVERADEDEDDDDDDE